MSIGSSEPAEPWRQESPTTPGVARALKNSGRRALRVSVDLVLFALAAAIVMLAGAAAMIYLGTFDLTGTAYTPAAARLVADTALQRSVQRRAADVAVPSLDGLGRLARGAALYGASCEACHRAPGVERSGIAAALNPAPSDLSLTASRWSPAELFWITRNGIRLSGMPGWRTIYSDEQLWDIVAVVSRLPGMSATEYAELQNASGDTDR